MNTETTKGFHIFPLLPSYFLPLCYIAVLLLSSYVLATFSGCLLCLLCDLYAQTFCSTLPHYTVSQSEVSWFPGFLWGFDFHVPKELHGGPHQSVIVLLVSFIPKQFVVEPLRCIFSVPASGPLLFYPFNYLLKRPPHPLMNFQKPAFFFFVVHP